jgi:hypothetical protein
MAEAVVDWSFCAIGQISAGSPFAGFKFIKRLHFVCPWCTNLELSRSSLPSISQGPPGEDISV